MNKNNPLLQEALGYAKRGWYVFPTREVPSEPFMKDGVMTINKVKSPYISGGFLNSSTDYNEISYWWKRYPNAGIGIDCGKSNLIVLDLDVRKGKDGFTSFSKLNISDEGALHAITPSGGLHIIYSGQSNSHVDVENGLDVRSKGAYIVAPPSWITEDDGSITKYSKVDDWSRTPVSAPDNLDELIDELRGYNRKDVAHNPNRNTNESPESLLKRVSVAIYKLPSFFYDDYFKWITVGMALKNDLGDRAFSLWDEWSQQSDKYNGKRIHSKWDTFKPSNVTVATIFYNAKVYSNE